MCIMLTVMCKAGKRKTKIVIVITELKIKGQHQVNDTIIRLRK
jgi:hypothetical protein